MGDAREKKNEISVSSLGSSLSANLVASTVVLSVAQELNDAAQTIEDSEERDRFLKWSDKLADAVITVSVNSSTTATEIQSLYAPDAKDK